MNQTEERKAIEEDVDVAIVGGGIGDIHYLDFPQGSGKTRLYVDYDISDRNRFGSANGAAKLLL